MKKILLLSFATLTTLQTFSQQRLTPTSINQKVKYLVSKMTLEEKVGQMTQISIEFLLKQENGQRS